MYVLQHEFAWPLKVIRNNTLVIRISQQLAYPDKVIGFLPLQAPKGFR
jgi:hypothetical protein